MRLQLHENVAVLMRVATGGAIATVLRWIGIGATVMMLGTGIVLATGYLLEGPSAPLERSDAIIVISGDEALSRFREGLRLYRAGWAPSLLFSGAAQDGQRSNAEDMRRFAIAEGVPPAAILVDHAGQDTLGNAVHTRSLMDANGLKSAILVTSPYHLRRAVLTFNEVYRGSGIRVIGRSAPDGDWRKASWWAEQDTRALTIRELQKLGYVAITGRFN